MKMRRERKIKVRTDRIRDMDGFIRWLMARSYAKRVAALKRLSQLSQELGQEL